MLEAIGAGTDAAAALAVDHYAFYLASELCAANVLKARELSEPPEAATASARERLGEDEEEPLRGHDVDFSARVHEPQFQASLG